MADANIPPETIAETSPPARQTFGAEILVPCLVAAAVWAGTIYVYLGVLPDALDRLRVVELSGGPLPWPTKIAMGLAEPVVVLVMTLVAYAAILGALFSRLSRVAWLLVAGAFCLTAGTILAVYLPLVRMGQEMR